MKKILLSLLLLLSLLSLIGCSKSEASYKDGVYQARSTGTDDHGGYGKVEITITDGKISDVQFQTFNKDDSIKDASYGQGLPEGQYKIAQASIAANAEYAKQLMEYQKLIDVDAISGATWNYQLFQDAVEQALQAAQNK